MERSGRFRLDGVRWEWPAVVMGTWRAGLVAWGQSMTGSGEIEQPSRAERGPGIAVERWKNPPWLNQIPAFWGQGAAVWVGGRVVGLWRGILRMKTTGEKKCCVGWGMWYGMGQLQERA